MKWNLSPFREFRGAAPGVVQAAPPWWAQVVDCVFLAQSAVAPELVEPNPVAAGHRNHRGGIRPTTRWMAQRRRSCSLQDDRHVKKLLRSFGVFLSLKHSGSAMTDFKTADPEQDILCDIRGVVGDSLEVS